jgi:hypothetical protein
LHDLAIVFASNAAWRAWSIFSNARVGRTSIQSVESSLSCIIGLV